MRYKIYYDQDTRQGTFVFGSFDEVVRLLEDDGDFTYDGRSFIEEIFHIFIEDTVWFSGDSEDIELQHLGSMEFKINSLYLLERITESKTERFIKTFNDSIFNRYLGDYKDRPVEVRNIPSIITRNNEPKIIFRWEFI